jgi:hypothetical protein
MPNWCNNYVELGHEDPAKIKVLAEAFTKNEFFNAVIPVPQELKDTVAGHLGEEYAQELNQFKMQLNLKYFGAKDWYDFCTSRWGTKWDVGNEDYPPEISEDGQKMSVSFESAWSPPVGVYQELVEQGYSVRAYYYESGMAFAGIWDNGSDDCYSDWGDSQGAKDMLPEELDEFFAISEQMADWEEEQRLEDDLYRFTKEGGEKLGLVEKT